jgi:hypothetical protein
MTAFSIDFDWFRCPQGYRVVRSGDIERRIANPDDLWIIPNSDERVFYRPLEKYDLLYIAYAQVKTLDHLLKFINLYGPLVRTSTVWGDSVSAGLRISQLFRDILRLKEKDFRNVMSLQIARKQAWARAHGIELPKADLRNFLFNELIGTVYLVPDPKKGLRLRIETDALWGALWWQLGQKLSSNAIIRECRYCGTLFETGPNKGRRADATFCCSEHSVRFHSLKRSSGR